MQVGLGIGQEGRGGITSRKEKKRKEKKQANGETIYLMT
jgi:hypothetical protein